MKISGTRGLEDGAPKENTQPLSFREQIQGLLTSSDEDAALQLKRALTGPDGTGQPIEQLKQEQAYELLTSRREILASVAADLAAGGATFPPGVEDALSDIGIAPAPIADAAATNDGYEPGLNQDDVQDLKNTLSSKSSSGE